MKILWVCNIMLPLVAEEMGYTVSNKEGWLSGFLNMILEEEETSDVTLAVCFPVEKKLKGLMGTVSGLRYIGFYEDTVHEELYDQGLEEEIGGIIKGFAPDVIHIFGTEFAHSLAVTKVFPYPQKILVGIQGVCYECAKAYMAGLPERIQNRSLFRDWVKKDNIRQQQDKFKRRGMREIEVLQNVGNVTGRTEFDRNFTKQTNKNAEYYFLNETLRSNFYEGIWELEKCGRNTLFMSQGNYPLKGLHFVLEAMGELIKEFKDLYLFVAGDRITAYSTWKDKLKIGSYGKYILELIETCHLQNHVTFEGRLNAAQMKERYLNSHIFISASSLENSPNAVGEAMLLGVPVISSKVGGVPSLVTDRKEALLFENGNSTQLSDAIKDVLTCDTLAMELSKNAKKRALETHDPKKNYNALIDIYRKINQKGEK